MGSPAEELKKSTAKSGKAVISVSPAADDPRWQVVQHVVSGQTFAKAARLSQFLLYVCERAILGRLDEVSEQQVGIHVFGRPADYNSNEDNIVRTHARLLRRKLDEYYLAEGKDEPLRILIPKGGYVPVFEAVPEPVAPGREPEAAHWLSRWKMAAVVVCLLLAAGAVVISLRGGAHRPNPRVRQFWSQIFNTARPTFLVPSDTGYVLYQNYTRRTVTLAEYLARDFWRQFETPPDMNRGAIEGLASLPYTNQVDLNLCWRLGRSTEMDLQRTAVRAPRELSISDLKGANALVMGARRGNPWAELFDQQNAFQGLFDETRRNYVLNREPRAGEAPLYTEHLDNGTQHAYAIVAFVRGITGQEHALLLSGTTTPGTEGAGDFLLNEQSLGSFLEKIAPGNGPVPHFELVLDVGRVGASAQRAEVVAYRVRKD